MSDNGQYYLACAGSWGAYDYCFRSINSGASFSSVTALGKKSWLETAVSGNGQYMAAVVGENAGDFVYVSSDYGANFTARGTNLWRQCIKISQTGQYMLTVVQGGGIYVSSDYGVNWTQSGTTTANWKFVAVCPSGQYMLCIDQTTSTGGAWLSTDYGVTFNKIFTTISGKQLHSGDVTNDGKYIVLGHNGGDVYYSSNYGASFSNISFALLGNQNWISLKFTSAD